MKKKVLIVVESLDCGGGEKSLISVLPELDYDKYEVDLLIYNRGGLFERFVDDRVHVVEPPIFVDFCKRSKFKQVLSCQFQFLIPRIKWAAAIRKRKNGKRHPSEVYWENCKMAIPNLEKKYDVAIAWGQGNSTHYVAEKVCSTKKYAWINADYILGRHDKEFDRPFYKIMDAIIVVSDRLLPITQAVFPEFSKKMRVIYDVVNSSVINRMAKIENAFPNDSGFKIVTVGRLETPKGYDLAVETCKILRDRGMKFTWYVVGEGSQRGFLEKKIRDYKIEKNFVLLGLKENPYPYIDKADIYVQTSIFEGYCLTLAEARILNKPIVSTKFDVVYDQIKNEVNGLVVDISPSAIADGVIRLANDAALRDNFVQSLKQEKKGNAEEAMKFMELLDS